MRLQKTESFCAWLVLCSCCIVSAGSSTTQMRSNFRDPPVQYWPRPLWFWNDTEVTIAGVGEQTRKSKELSKYGGFGILPFGKDSRPDYLSEEYFAVYGAALEQARRLGMTMSLYDEYGFPSGSAGAPNSRDTGLFQQKYPDLTLKRLDKHEQTVAGPSAYEAAIPSGTLMSVVAMNTATLERIHLTDTVDRRSLRWDVPRGTWKVMIFVCVTDGYPCCDYLDPEAVDAFIEMTHQAYYDRFKDHFGTTIDSTFHDEPTLYRGEGRTWTDRFNERFERKHGFDPRPYYPALWYDIGPDTQAARNYLFGFRTALYALGFPKRIQDWCDEHGIEATGHQDQEEVANPVSVAGDLMKCFQHQEIPGVDKIGGNRPAERVYKVISSAAYNWDRTLVMSETYGAMGDLSWNEMYIIALEQYTKGINLLIPHAVWYDDTHVAFEPELSYRSPIYADGLPEFNTCLARLNVMLQNDACHVADIAVLYPIATLQGSHHLDGPLGYYQGGVAVPEADYLDVGETLIAAGRDYTFLHPDVLDERCTIEGNELLLRNKIHPGRFKVLVLPGHKTIRWSNLRKIKAFHDAGGKVIATGELPSKSAEFGHDADVAGAIATMFAKKPDAATLRERLDNALAVYDVEYEGARAPRYIHKVKDGVHVYLFANIDPTALDTHVILRGRLELEAWDPHTGNVQPAQYTHEIEGDCTVTRVRLTLPPVRSLFFLGRQNEG
ncbi:MAG: glycosyl hydrolase [Sedimentisphaerales bacterium]|jgi:hypothetical protein|nr:glycosyl hydrolase [Sedimentisphaerales bacterium]HNY76756.1 glycosyl hydrolase [Sedimentisphaerales bacterium]HOC61637.1 glycosyl hydrolase [Sedimentisphaerales bacterium]HOH62469.1 glycosyl hydrolase [Sedimentisphaerales bacterium]HPY50882.1 glycosyl hydrolase [Sedimentisphaerales bacterium]